MAGDELGQLRLAVALGQLLHARGEHERAGDECMNVAEHLRGRAAVASEDAPDVVIRLARLIEPDRRQRHPFGERVGRQRREPAGDGAAQIRHVDERAREEADPPAEEDGPEDQDVVGMDAAEIRVVHRKDVARLHGTGVEDVEHGGQAAAQARTVHQAGRGGLRHQLAGWCPAVRRRRRHPPG